MRTSFHCVRAFRPCKFGSVIRFAQLRGEVGSEHHMLATAFGLAGLAPSALIAEGPRSLLHPQSARSGVALSADAGARKVLWEPKPEVMEQTAMRRFQHAVRGGRGVEGSYEELWKWSVENSDAFWTTLLDFVQIEYSGSTTPAKVGTLMPDVTYFPNVEVNFAENLLKHGAPGAPLADAEAVVSISEARDDVRWTFSELRDDAARVQAALKALGVSSSDACGAYMSNVGETVVAMLGATSLGATWTSCSPDFGAQAVADRFGQVAPKVCQG